MTPAYFDSSAIVKLVLHERETGALLDYLSRPFSVSTSAVSVPEVHRTLRRTLISRQDIEASLIGIYLIALSPEILTHAAWSDPPRVRTLDAIHLASAHVMRAPNLEFVTYDHRLADAARASGLHVVQPGI